MRRNISQLVLQSLPTCRPVEAAIVKCQNILINRPSRVSLFHTIMHSEFYIMIKSAYAMLVLCLPMLSLTVVLRVLVFSV